MSYVKAAYEVKQHDALVEALQLFSCLKEDCALAAAPGCSDSEIARSCCQYYIRYDAASHFEGFRMRRDYTTFACDCPPGFLNELADLHSHRTGSSQVEPVCQMSS
jgi:hypothetical protein